MKKSRHPFFSIILFSLQFIVSISSIAQTKKLDSLQNLLKTATDTSKISYTERIAREYLAQKNTDMAVLYFKNEAELINEYLIKENNVFSKISVNKEFNNKKLDLNNSSEPAIKIKKMLVNSMLNSYVNTGIIYSKKGDFLNALDFFVKAYEFSKEQNDKGAMAGTLNNIGIVYQGQGNYPKAVDCYFQSLKINEELNDTVGVATSYINIGNVYLQEREYTKALEQYFKAKKIVEEINFGEGIVNTTHNIGLIYFEQKNYEKALNYFFEAFEISKKLNDNYLIAQDLSSIGRTYYYQKDYEKAFDYGKQALEIREKIGDIEGLSTSLITMSKIYLAQKETNLALKYCTKSIEFARKIGSLNNIEEAEKLLSDIYFQLGDNKNSLEHYKLYIIAKDSLSNEANTKRIMQAEMDFTIDKKENKIALLQKDKALQSEQIEKEKWIKNLYLGGFLAIVLVLFGTLFYIRIVRANKKINVEKRMIELEQKLLRSQMNPHFIFNSLGIIHEYIQKNKSEEAGEYLVKFSKLMRLILENSRQEYVPLEKEIETLKHYLNLYQLVLQKSFNYQLNIDENIDTEITCIPPMLAQPFIENALKHGIADKKEGELIVNFKKSGELILFEVIDNGIGYSRSQELKKEKNNKHESLARQIVYERLDNINKDKKKKIQINISDIIDGSREIIGTKVAFEIPVIYSV